MKNVLKVCLGLILILVPAFLILFAFDLFDNNIAVQDTETEIVFAIIGDYGVNTIQEKKVSDLVHSWNPQFIITTGDNNYYEGKFLDTYIGKFYSDFIGNYKGVYGKGSEQNRFYPSIGNHDWDGIEAKGFQRGYFDFFSVLKEYSATSKSMLYYDFEISPIHFFVLDSDTRQPNGIDKNSVQAQWLRRQMEKSSSNFNIVIFHNPPFTNTKWKTPEMDWPFKEWGADIVISGHAHTYERFDKNGLPYVVNGLGGAQIFCLSGKGNLSIPSGKELGCRFIPPPTKDPDTVIDYNSNWGAMIVKSTNNFLNFTFIDIDNSKIDSFIVYSKNQQ